MDYSNPEIPEGINTSKDHPIKEFILLLGGVISSIAVLILVLILLSDFLVKYIPFSWEQKINLPFSQDGGTEDNEHTPQAIEVYLQELANRIVKVQDLPEGMTIKVHYLDTDTVNAFATLGGHVFLFRGLLEKLPNENALAMVMGHEIAHIKYRHPIHSLSRGVIVGLVLSLINSSMGDAIMQNFINEAGYLTVLKYSRDMENESDESATQALLSLYGHLEGANDLFKVLQQETQDIDTFEFFSTHPLTEKRIHNVQNKIDIAKEINAFDVSPLPEEFTTWLSYKKEEPTSKVSE